MPKTKPHLTVACDSASQIKKWGRAAKITERKRSSWVRVTLDAEADRIIAASESEKAK